MKKYISIVIFTLLAVVSVRAEGGSSQAAGRFLGLNGTVGAAFSYYTNPDYHTDGFRPGIKIGVDCAYPVGDRFAVGFYTTLGGGPVFSRRVAKADKDTYHNGPLPGFDLKVGLLALVGDLSDKPFIIGLAPCSGFGMCNPVIYLPIEARFGRVVGKRLYVTGNLAVGAPLGYKDGTEHYLFIEPSISLGFNFGPRKKNRQ